MIVNWWLRGDVGTRSHQAVLYTRRNVQLCRGNAWRQQHTGSLRLWSEQSASRHPLSCGLFRTWSRNHCHSRWKDIYGINTINFKNCSLFIMLTATFRKPQKSHCLKVNVMLSNITFLMTCGFWSVAVDSIDKLQFWMFVFAVFLPNLCNVLLWNYWIYLSSFSSFTITAVRHITLSKIKTLT